MQLEHLIRSVHPLIVTASYGDKILLMDPMVGPDV